MAMSLRQVHLLNDVLDQIDTLFPDGSVLTNADLHAGVSDAIGRPKHYVWRIKAALCSNGRVATNDRS